MPAFSASTTWPVPKFRRPGADERVDTRLVELILQSAALRDMKVHALEAVLDHVHWLIETDPRHSSLVRSKPSRVLRMQFSAVRSHLPTL
jgi:REP element-mobilizing transposase RayT